MRVFLSLIFVFMAAVVHVAAGGEAVPLSAAMDPGAALWRILVDFGSLGAFVLYLIWQRRDESKQKIKDNERWHELDKELVALVRECCTVISEVRASIHENTLEMRRHHTPANGDRSYGVQGVSGGYRQGETRVIRND